MSFTDEFYSILNKKKKKDEKDEGKKTSSSEKSLADSFAEEFYSKVGIADETDDIAPLYVNKTAPLYSSIGIVPEANEDKKRTWFNTGAFDDGFQISDIPKVILGTVSDLNTDIGAGALGIVENTIDAGAYLVGGAGGLLGFDDFKKGTEDFIKKDIIDEQKWSKFLGGTNSFDVALNLLGTTAEDASILGGRTDSLVQSGGQLAGTIALQGVGVPWWLTSGVTSFGSGVEGSMNEGASFEKAGLSAAISAGAEVLTEKLSGGISFGGKTIDDVLLKPLTEKIASKSMRFITNLGIDAVGEGLEEVFSQTISNLGTALYKEDSIEELLFSEQAMDEYLESFIGGAVLGGVGNVTQAVANRNSVKLTEDEQKVFDKVYEDELAKEDGEVTEKRKNEIRKEVLRMMQRGYISTETIEEVLGGDTYKNYKDTIEKEESAIKEFEELYEGEELRQQIAGFLENSERGQMKTNLSKEVMSLVKDSRLAESYNERSRRGQAYEANLELYPEKQRATIQKAVDSGILNNTNRTHEFVDMVARITAEKGVLFDFTSNEKLKDSVFAVDGKTVNGYVTKDGVTLNINSAKALETVVGHEITHVLEGTALYNELKTAVVKYASTKGEYKGRYDAISNLYKSVENVDIDAELTADLVGDYLFNDTDFVRHLSTANRNVFQKVWDEIKYLYKVATAGSKEARQLEKLKKAFEDAYRESGKKKDGTQYSVSNSNDFALSDYTIDDILKWSDEEFDRAYQALGLDSLLEMDDDVLVDDDSAIESASESFGVETEAIKILFRRNGLGTSHVEDNRTAVMTEKRIDQRIAEHGAGRSDYARRYITRISPKDFIDMTVYERNMDRENFDTRVRGDLDGKMGDWDYEKQLHDSEEPPVLIIEKSTGQIIGHNGRHRVRALEMAGIESVEIEVELHDEDGYLIKYNAQTIHDMAISSQFDTAIETHLSNIVPLNKAHRAEIMSSYGENAHANAGIKYSISDSDGKQLTDGADSLYSLNETPMEQRLSGDDLLDAQDLIAEIGDVATISPNGYVTVYHRTTEENANRIMESGKMSAKEDGIFFSTQKDGNYSVDYGKGVVELKVPVEKLILDDLFDTEAHLRIPLENRNAVLDVSEYLAGREVKDAQQDYTTEGEVSFSLSNDTAYMSKAIEANKSSMAVDSNVMEDAKSLRERIAVRMNDIKDRGLVALPDDVEGNTYIANSSYDGTEENTTICPRSLASEAFVDAVSEYLGRPLTVEEQIYISQDLQGRTLTPECLYCYVATDRKAYRAFLGDYVAQRDAVLEKVKANPSADVSRSGDLYKEFLNGRKDTNPMYNRFKMWVDAYRNGKPMVDASHLANINKLMGDINSEFGAELKPQIVDAMKYAQSASWAKKRVNYVAYNGHILKWKQDRINKLNSHYGLRMYSFSDFHPAFVLENMQMITDASVRGLKMLGYTKDTDFVEIFAPSGMNINVSTFGFESGGEVFENNLTGADWETAKKLREQYPNVGVTFVATNDTLVEWALAQDWIDVVIPYHLVRTGAEVAKALEYTNYTSESSDTKTAEWKKGDKKYIAPTEHNNDKATYLAALEKNHLKPRFERFLENPNYMKLVNECRQPASQSKPVQPVFNEDAAMVALAKLEANGYYQPIGGSVDRMYEIAAEVAENMRNDLAPAMSLSDADETPVRRGFGTYGSDIALESQPIATESQMFPDDIAPVAEKPTKEAYEAITPKKEKQPSMAKATPEEQARAEILVDEPAVEKKKSGVMSKIRNLVLDKGMVFENLSLKTGNRELQARWDSIRRAEGRAQRFMESGNAMSDSLKSIKDRVEKTGKTKQFYEYLYHLHNADRMTLESRYEDTKNKPVFGYGVTAEMSQDAANKLEKANPEFKQFAQDVYSYMGYLREMLVDGGVISRETAKLWAEMYPHYVPIRRVGDEGLNINVPLDTGRTGVNAPVKRATGGNSDILPLFDTMGQRTLQTFKAIAKNRFGVELKNTLGTTIDSDALSLDEAIDSMDAQDLLQEGKNGRSPTFTVFENGEKVTFEITDEMYDAMKPTSDALAYTNKALNTMSNLRRGVITEYNPWFLLKNAVKDVQDVLINSQHAVKTYAAIPKAIKQMSTNGHWYREYLDNGGDQDTYFDRETNTFKEEDKTVALLKKVTGLDFIAKANNVVERLPRLAEYIASRESGRSVDVSMLDAARVTTNFAAGGDLTKFLNRNGATFLNASVQGAMQNVRNIREAKMNGLKGWASLAGKFTAAALPAIILNNFIWDDDEEYDELSDYVKQNYYIVGKYGDGKFVRIPKGRTVAVIQNAIEQISNAATGDDEVDLNSFVELVIGNLAPNNPIDNNILSPIIQVANNETWYGEDLVPTRLADLPAAEQYDETTDSISKWLGETFNISPYKANYLIDQYSGVVGDTILPMLTPEAESGDDSFLGNMIAPLKDMFTTDSVQKNQNVSDFYDLKGELTVNANASGATDEDVLRSKYMNSVNSELAQLYAEKRKLQNSDLSDAEKYAAVRDVQKQIVELTKEAMNTYSDISYEDDYREGGEYARVGERLYKLNKDGEWQKLTDEQVTKYEVTKAAGDASYATDGTNHYRWYEPGEDAGEDAEAGWRKVTDKELERQDEVTSGLGITPEEYWNNREEYSYAYDNPESYAVAKAVGGYDAYRGYSSALYDIKADKDKYGKSISGSRKEKVLDYINNLDADYYTKIILWKSEYTSDDSYNEEIIEYLNSRDDISFDEMVAILRKLGFGVTSDGHITW